MKVVVTGGAGFVGEALARALLARGRLTGPDGAEAEIAELVLVDTEAPAGFDDARVRTVAASVTDAAAVAEAVGGETGALFHLAAVVSAGAEADFALGYRVNLDGTRNLLAALRRAEAPPRLVFASSIGVYGGPLPEVVTEETPAVPQLSYGTQKRIGELLIADHARRGLIDGRSARLPTVLVRPTPPNAAASTWTSSIIRELWRGNDYVCPVGPHSAMACLSVDRTAEALIRLHEAPGAALQPDRVVLLPGLRATAGEMADAVARVAAARGRAGEIGRIDWRPDPDFQRLVDGFVKETRSVRAEALGIDADESIDEIVRRFADRETV